MKLTAASALGLAIGLIWIRAGLNPLHLLCEALIHGQAAWFWITREAAPAVRRVAGRYRECVEAVRRGE